ncbi:MAG TPA: hypothetical protein VFQ35_23360, partial [Polyangiaceae bacterium]|nr:hypothetical protein [Polyangiaceae bacterium]
HSLIPNRAGRVGLAGEPVARSYVVGWIKRGPVGLLGTNKQDARETVAAMLEDAPSALGERSKRTPGSALQRLDERGVRRVTYADWQKIDAQERKLGAAMGKIREKFASVAELLQAIESG